MRIVVFNRKGGVGKSTIAISVASELQRRGRRVLLGDADDQRTALTWASHATEQGHLAPTAIGLHTGFHKPGQLPDAGYDYTVLDLPGRDDVVCRAGLLIADAVIVPVQAGAIEAWALASTLKTIGEARVIRPQLQPLIVINRDAPRTTMAKNTRQALEGCGIQIARTTLGSRVAFVEAIAAGQGPSTYQPEGAAAKEIVNLVNEIQENLSDAEAA